MAKSTSEGTLSHLDEQGRARMVEVGEKEMSRRSAVASGTVRMSRPTMEMMMSGSAPKGDVLAAARIAGIQAAKRTSELIPLCHLIRLTSCEIRFWPDEDSERLHIQATARARERTGVEMEALTAVSIAALTIYDMLKAVDRAMTVEQIALEEKHGGSGGEFSRRPAL